jgi:hypothetical protein
MNQIVSLFMFRCGERERPLNQRKTRHYWAFYLGDFYDTGTFYLPWQYLSKRQR